MERTMTIKKFFAPSTTRLGRQQWFRNVWQRLTMVLMLVMLTTATAWAQETPMTVTAENVTVTYDGSEHYITVNVSDPESGATITYCETENGTYTDTNPTYTNAGVNTVYYKVTASGYADYSGSATVTINKAPLTITANSKSINYGDEPANNGVTYGEFVNGENKDYLGGTLGFEYNYSQGDPVGTYQITPNGLTSDNYAITFVPGTLTVDKKSLTVAANDITIDHGAAAPAYTYSVTGLVNGESLTTEPTLSSTYTQGAAIGTYPISISGAAASANYTISYTPGTLTVQSKKYTVTFQNEDGTQLQSSEVEWGETPAYTGETPTKDATAQYTYTFAGWTPEIVAVTEDATYTATYSSTLRTNGYCGTDDPKTTDVDESVNVTWNYNTSTKTITIAGSGPMMYYNSVQNGENWNNGAPWRAYAGEVEHVVISDGITYVGSNTFAHCPNISSVTLPTDQQLYEIGPGAFGDCTSLTSIDIPMSVNKINDGAFAGCSNLASVTLGYGNGAKFTIGKEVFPATTTIIVPLAGLLSYLGADGWSAYADKVMSTGYCGKDNTETTDVDESRNVIWTLAKNTGDQIEGNEPLTLTISKNPEVTAAGADFSMADDYPFNDGVSGISEYEYTTSMSITQAVIGDGVTSIGENAFLNCENLATVSIPSSVTSIGVGAFVECKSLTSNITIPDGVTVINNSTFNGCAKLTTVVLPSGLTTIGASAFAGCDKLSSIGVAGSTTNALPTSLTAIGTSAFSGSGLPAITLNEGLETIAGDAFNRTGLTTINIPASVENIGEGAFTCFGLESISVADGNTHFTTDGKALIAHIDDNNTTLLTYARANTETTSYAVPDGVTRIGAGAFSDSDHLTEVILPEGLKTIGDHAFYVCDAITDIAIPASVESIGTEGFGRCYKLATIRVFRGATNGITTIGVDAFTGTDVTRRIYVPASALDTYRAAVNWEKYYSGGAHWIVAAPWGDALRGGFCGVDDAATTTIDESKNVAWALTANGDHPEGCDTGSGLTLTISKNPEVTAEGADFSMADGWPFDDGDGGVDEVTTALSITQAVIGEGVTGIGARAFQNCWNMATVSIPSTVTSIGVSAFNQCKSLTSNITIPDGVTVINNSTFNGCEKLTTVVLPSGLTTIGASAFAGCDKLSSIGVANSETNELPTSLTAIGTSAFTFSSLPAITLNNGLETIDVSAFSYTNLTTINIPASVENIGEDAFTCNYLESISVADGNTHFITDGKTLIALIDDNNKTLLTYARANTETTSYAVPDGVTRIGADAFSESDHLTEVILPEGLKTIGDGAFSYCDELTNVILPEGLTTIDAKAFNQCHKIETFVVPSTVTYIGDYGLLYNDYCIMLPTTPPELGWGGTGTFAMGVSDGYPDDGFKIYVPASSLNAYRQADVWKLFSSIRLVAGDDPVLFSSTATNAWMTWCSDKAYGKPVGCKAYTVSAVNDGEVTLTPVAGLLLPAYTPLLIKRDDTSAALTAIGGAAVTAPTSGYNATTGLVTQSESNFNMLGNATDADVSNSITAGYSYALFDGEFLKIDDSTLDIPAHRCILTLDVPLSAPRLHININGEATSLSEAKEDSSLFTLHSSLSGWYTLDGRKLDKQPTTKGLYIYKGKKVVIK